MKIFSQFSRSLSPLPRGPQNFASVCANPIEALPQTNFSDFHHQQQQQQQHEQHINFPPPVPPRTSCFSPQLTRDTYQTSHEDENVAIQNQVRLIKFLVAVLSSPLLVDPCVEVKSSNCQLNSLLRMLNFYDLT